MNELTTNNSDSVSDSDMETNENIESKFTDSENGSDTGTTEGIDGGTAESIETSLRELTEVTTNEVTTRDEQYQLIIEQNDNIIHLLSEIDANIQFLNTVALPLICITVLLWVFIKQFLYR